ncbi:MAG: TylF/MycF/NovP-related O-methyltransferase, partial [Candidatus Omnitrophota bacterium]
DVFKKSDLSDTDFAEVRRYLSDCPNVVFYEGIFSKTFPTIPNRLFSFVHVDCDLHLSVLECCEFFYPKMAPGGVILFDDYGFLCAPGAKKAVDAFFSDKPEYPVALSTGQCIVVKS